MRADLLARLQAGATLVTPNRRLAQRFKQQFDLQRAAAGLVVWATPDILPWPAFVTRCFETIALGADAAPLLLSPEQEGVLWESAVERAAVEAGLLSVAQTAAQCANAWTLAHAWHLWPRLKLVPLADDARAFVAWAEAFENLCRRGGYLDGARVAAWVETRLADPHWQRPAQLLLAGFDIEPPAQRSLLDAFERVGTQVERLAMERPASPAKLVACPSAESELAAAARWARSRLAANPLARIGIVVPDLAERRATVLRVFSEMLAAADPRVVHRVSAIDVSIGVPLTEWPMVHDALSLLDAARQRPLPLRDWSALLLSPFITGAQTEYLPRARLDAALRESCAAEESLEGMQRAIGAQPLSSVCPLLVACIASLVDAARGGNALPHAGGGRRITLPPSGWGRRFTEWLALAGFPGERTLDSVEHQTLVKFRALLEGMAALDRVLPRIALADALSWLHRAAAETLFQPEIPALPIQALGILESAGLDFDHLWVTGLTADAWPLAARPNPFLPVSLQRQAGVPEASAAASLDIDRRITEGWFGAAPEVVVSYAMQDGDRELRASPLVKHLAQAEVHDVAPQVEPTWRERIFAVRAHESLVDETAPGFVVTAPLSSGAAALRDQSACPFRAQARHRLHAWPLRQPEPGLDGAERGTLIHAVLQRVWTELKDQDGLFDRDEAALVTEVRGSVAEVLAHHRAARVLKTTPRLAAVEAARLERLVLLWLEVERERAPFAMQFVEDKRLVQAGALPLNVKLDRMDRILLGELAGSSMVIDYKTGRSGTAAWEGERLDEPQLPLYLLASEEDIAALAFAQLRLGEMGLKGLSRAGGFARGVNPPKPLPDESDADAWQRYVADWRRNIAALGDAFVAGAARVDPKDPVKTCNQCDLHMLCRVADNYGGDAETAEAAEGADDE